MLPGQRRPNGNLVVRLSPVSASFFNLLGVFSILRKVIKKIRVTSEEDAAKLEINLREAEFLVNLSHPNILKGFDSFFYEADLHNKFFIIVTEFCEVESGFEAKF